MTVITAAMLNDMVGWFVFGLIIGMLPGSDRTGFDFQTKLLLTVVFFVSMLSIGTWLLHRGLGWISRHARGTDPLLAFVLAGALFSAAFTEWIGIHPVFGAFVFGAAPGESGHLSNRIRVSLNHFVSFFFTSVFFGSIGLHLDLVRDFSFSLCLTVVVLATVCKLAGCALGAKLAGESSNYSLAIGSALNARGAMEIILGLAAHQAGVISASMLVALIVMALVTSMNSGTLIEYFLNREAKAAGQ